MLYQFTIPNYIPPRANALFRSRRRKRMALEQEAKQFVGVYGTDVPKARFKRRASMVITLGPRMRTPDADENLWKAILDALVWHGKLINDTRTWCECGKVFFIMERAAKPGTRITLEEMP